MAVTASLLTAGGTSSALTTFTTASITPSANKLVGVWVLTDGGTPNSISGCGLTWVRDVLDTVLVPVAFFRSMGASPSTGTLSISLSANSVGSWIVVEYDGVDTTGTNGSGAIVQTAHTTGTGKPASVTLASGITSGNATVAGFIKGTTGAWTAGAGYTKLGETTASGFAAHAHEWAATGTQAPDATYTGANANWAGIAVEVKAAGAAATDLVIAAAAHSQTAGSLTLTQVHELVVAAATHGQTASSLTLTQVHELVIAAATHAQTAGNLDLTQAHQLVVQGSAHSQTAGSLTLDTATALVIAGAAHAHTADGLSLTQTHVLAVAAATHAQTAGQLALTQLHLLAIDAAAHIQTADNVVVSTIPPPRWVEGAAGISSMVEAAGGVSGQVEAAGAVTGTIEGAASL